MSNITTAKRERKHRNITVRMIEKPVAKQTKYYDREIKGLYVSVLPSGAATFNLKYTCAILGKRASIKVGIFHRELFGVDKARIMAMALRARIGNGEDIAAAQRQAKARRAKLSGTTVDEVIDQYIAWIRTPLRKPDGEMRPRLESWQTLASQLNRFVRPRLGSMIASEVCNGDIAKLQSDILEGKTGNKPSLSNARHMRKGVSGLFRWAAQPSRAYIHRTPCHDLEPLDREHPRTRVLSDNEIRVLWHGLDREDLPWDRRTRLAIKFALVSMLRSGELLPIHRSELTVESKAGHVCVGIPFKRLKNRRHRPNPHPMKQPLSDLAMEIVREAVASNEQRFVFESPIYPGQPLHRHAMSVALRGTKHETSKGKTKTPGLCELLGIKPFTPHDLRRTAATLAGRLRIPRSQIAIALGHADPSAPVVTGVYDTADRTPEAREVLEKVATEIRRIIDSPADAAAPDALMPLAA
ncbi:integrase family protein [Bradyrhizobium sp. AUGA SZCCT0176]|uniref:tyrosine-type recombinase/integrase n=1 Tax=Bradyrhizobium sp. AUGA SZCCT0176 TaxID=2807664 RepID=UPI001BA985B3|nr:integrase family protein [Bradyrhizobium sp. AUGA SZCCT0176]MBR1227027.1 integrase family protein [Bradyrhizobium sp. AUGA SZCCT0176]